MVLNVVLLFCANENEANDYLTYRSMRICCDVHVAAENKHILPPAVCVARLVLGDAFACPDNGVHAACGEPARRRH